MKKFLITERSLNYILRPVQVRKCNYPHTYHVENLNQKISVTVDRPWTYASHLILDFIGHESYEIAYRNITEKRNTWKNNASLQFLQSVAKLKEHKDADLTPELEPYAHWFEKYMDAKIKEQELTRKGEYSDELNAVNNQIAQFCQEIDRKLLVKFDKIYNIRMNGRGVFAIEINLRNFLQRYKMFFSESRRAEYLHELIKRTAEVKFTFDYPLQHPVIETYQRNGETKTKVIATRLETVRVENCNFFNYEIKNGTLLVKFNTFLGKLYTHNLLTLNTDWYEEEYLKLNGLASAIYRRFFVTKSKKNKEFELPIKDMFEYFKWSKNSQYPKLVVEAFENIKNVGLIESYTVNSSSSKFSKGYIQVKRSSK